MFASKKYMCFAPCFPLNLFVDGKMGLRRTKLGVNSGGLFGPTQTIKLGRLRKRPTLIIPVAGIGNSNNEHGDESFEESVARDAAWHAYVFDANIDEKIFELARNEREELKKSRKPLQQLELWEACGLNKNEVFQY
jgi:hypothetical protein